MGGKPLISKKTLVKGYPSPSPCKSGFSPRNLIGMNCRDCSHFLPSSQAGQRASLEGFGYCKAAPTTELRARFFRNDSGCWLPVSKFAARKDGGENGQ